MHVESLLAIRLAAAAQNSQHLGAPKGKYWTGTTTCSTDRTEVERAVFVAALLSFRWVVPVLPVA
jgi:hypothetical protein